MFVVLIAVMFSMSQVEARSDVSVTDNGTDVTGKLDVFSRFNTKKTEREDYRVLYHGKWLTYKQYRAAVVLCEARGGTDCYAVDALPGRDSPAQTAISLVARLRLPDPMPQFGPDPSVNE